MVTLINATHRPQNLTLAVVKAYEALLQERGMTTLLMGMDQLPADFLQTDGFGKRSDEVERLLETYLDPSERLVIVAPEYNGSFPGIFKAFIDGVEPVRWQGKKAALVGVASGRAGNLRGMDHLTDVLHHLGVEVLSSKVPISRVNALLNDSGHLADQATLKVLERQAERLLRF